MAKYNVPDDHWEEDDDQEIEEYSPTSVDSHEVDVILTTDPNEDMGYGREKYTAVITHDEDGPTVLYFIKHRWKGNFWRDTHELDWKDVTYTVKKQVAEVVDCDGVDDLDPECRLIEEGGRCTHRRKKSLEESRKAGGSE